MIPLVSLSEEVSLKEVSASVVRALQTSGFLLVESPYVPLEMQTRVLTETKHLLISGHPSIIQHPSDPKVYVMLDSVNRLHECDLFVTDSQRSLYKAFCDGLHKVRDALLRCLAIGLNLPALDYLVKLHSRHNSALRLLHYPSPSIVSSESIRCKAHSDYGSLTLLLTDGVPGLQAYIDGEWIDVTTIPGALVVNIGSLLCDWTNGTLKATLHRVVSQSPASRTSVAFFCDPDPDVATSLKESSGSPDSNMTVAEYITWRSGGSDKGRTGIAFTASEEDRLGSQVRPT